MKAVFLFVCLALFGACGELDMVLPGEENWQIKTLVNDISLEECALIRQGDTVQLRCEDSVTAEPGVCALEVLIQSPQKETAKRMIRYVVAGRAGFDFPAGEFTDAPVKNDAPAKNENQDENQNDDQVEEASPDTDAASGDLETGGELLPEDTSGVETEKVIIVDGLGEDLPPFQIPEHTEKGPYTLIFRILGEKEILGEIKQDFYYLGEALFSLNDIRVYLPGVFSESRLVPPETTVLLEAAVESDPAFSPRVIWYNGKEIIKEGSLSAAGLVFWKTPAQTGFQTLRVEIFPSRNQQGMKGISGEIVLPVSAKAPKAGFFSAAAAADIEWLAAEDTDNADAGDARENTPELKHWYQFAGDLADSAAPRPAGNTLIQAARTAPRWRPAGYSYGLAAGPSDVYSIPRVQFARNGNDGRGGVILFRVKPVSGGTLMDVLLPPEAPGEGAAMKLLLDERGLVLKLHCGESSAGEISLPVDSGETVIAAVIFYLYHDRLEARLVTEKNPAALAVPAIIKIPGPLGGQFSVNLGSAETDTEEDTEVASEEPRPARAVNNTRNLPPSAIWNQLAILSVVPPEPSEIAEPAAETEIAYNTDPAPANDADGNLAADTTDGKPEQTAAGIAENP